jgi:hypothetical protein
LSLIMAILTGVRWNLNVVICISFVAGKLNTSSCIYWSFVPLPLRIYLIHVPLLNPWVCLSYPQSSLLGFQLGGIESIGHVRKHKHLSHIEPFLS